MSSAVVRTQTFAALAHTVSTDLISSLRMFLAPLAFLVLTIEGFSAYEQIPSIKVLLVIYAVYAFVLWIPALRTKPVLQSLRRHTPWIDITWFTLIFAFSHTNHRIVFLGGFLFASLASSLSSGDGSELKLGTVSITVTGVLLIIFHIRTPQYEWGQELGFLLLLIAITSLTAILSSILRLQRELCLLDEVASLSNSHVGADRAITSVLERVRSFYAAKACVMFMGDNKRSTYRIWRVDRDGSVKRLSGEVVSEELQAQLGGFSSSRAVVYTRAPNRWLRLGKSYYELDLGDGSKKRPIKPIHREAVERAATNFEAESLLGVPVTLRHRIIGQFYLASEKPGSFSQARAKAVHRLIARIIPLVDALRMADRLTSEATGPERTKLACDIHDSMIQPYLGIQLGLTALRRKIQRGEIDLEQDISKLMEMTDGEIFGLRRYMAGLNGKEVNEATLLESICSFARKFSGASGIPVEVRNGSEMKIGDRLAEEVFLMIVEGLSNIRKHTQANRAIISFECKQNHLALGIEDEGSGERTHRGFIPRSIMTRVTALGGKVQVRPSDRGGTAINIKIPL